MTTKTNAGKSLEEQAERIASDLVIPPCPAILAQFTSEMNRDDPDLRKLAGYIGADAALSAAMAHLLRFTNREWHLISRNLRT